MAVMVSGIAVTGRLLLVQRLGFAPDWQAGAILLSLDQTGAKNETECGMALFDDVPVEKPAPHRIGEDLGRLSIDELNERITLLEGEIGRLREAIEAKTASRAAASSFFKS
ncbi:DUF1192 domain-containing protein [Kaistia sp. 32K]|uniref:DUF1192 domain-containing protein n=1 Tax=Kaistia sp. 32K TaxID=2795690 RepID=UPI003530537F